MANPLTITDIQQQRLTLLHQKLAKLYEQFDLETDAARKFQLEHLIKDTEAEIQGLLHSPPSPALPPQGGQGVREGKPMSDAMKAAWIGAAAVLLGIIITVIMVFTSGSKGDCSGDLSNVTGGVEINCHNQGGK
ncbi:MAG: hypothetical protein WAQ53_04285 [Thiofilum sp.]|uniref:hypothetical protein n=1 Tax=Thiofilum sp. TaxID=2212733 RepID=UPI0025D124F8|nr:hypothetical protein [Thiofilum sp.]MBK8454909.1 hypothetical protein [Thiofilum sp.]